MSTNNTIVDKNGIPVENSPGYTSPGNYNPDSDVDPYDDMQPVYDEDGDLIDEDDGGPGLTYDEVMNNFHDITEGPLVPDYLKDENWMSYIGDASSNSTSSTNTNQVASANTNPVTLDLTNTDYLTNPLYSNNWYSESISPKSAGSDITITGVSTTSSTDVSQNQQINNQQAEENAKKETVDLGALGNNIIAANNAIKFGVEMYNSTLDEVVFYIDKIKNLPKLLETKSAEYLEEQQYKLTRKVIALLDKAKTKLTKIVTTQQQKISDAIASDKAKMLERKLKEIEDKEKMVLKTIEMSSKNPAQAVEAYLAEKALKAKKEAERAKALADGVADLSKNIKDAAQASQRILSLGKDITAAAQALVDVQVLSNIKNTALRTASGFKRSLTSSIRGNLTEIKGTTLTAVESVTTNTTDYIYDKLNSLKNGLGSITDTIFSNADMLNKIPGVNNVLNINQAQEYGIGWLNDNINTYINKGSNIVNDALNDTIDFADDGLSSITNPIEGEISKINNVVDPLASNLSNEISKISAPYYQAVNSISYAADEIINDEDLYKTMKQVDKYI